MENKIWSKCMIIIYFTVLILALILVSACAETTTPVVTTPAVPTPQASSAPQYGGILKLAVAGTIVNLGDPTTLTGSFDSHSNRPAAESLLRIDPKGSLIPWLATGWQISPDKLSITLTLQKGVKFHDNTDFNAEAVKFNLDRFMASGRTELKSVKSVDIIDDYTVRLNLTEYDNTLLANLAYSPSGPGMMISPTSVKTHPKEWLLTNVIGTGAFKLDSFKRDVALKYTKWEQYWQKGKPYLDGVDILFVANETTLLMMLKAGEIDQGQLGNVKDALELEATGKYNFAKTTSNVVALVGDSVHADSPFSDVRIRRAISYAIDNKAITEGLGKGLLIPGNQPAGPENWYYSSEVKGYPYDPQKAKSLLAEAGYIDKELKTTLIDSRQSDYNVAVQGYLKKVGIDLKLDVTTTSKAQEISRNGWQNSMIGMSIRIPLGFDPSTTAINNFSLIGKQFVSMLHPPEIENTINLTKTESLLEKRKVLFSNLYKSIIDDHCLINPLYVNKTPQMNSVKLHDSQIGISPGNWYPESAWLSK